MADKKINLDNLVLQAIHRPRVRNMDELPPLYARVAGGDEETTFDSAGMSNPYWISAVAQHYNSPTNVRRLILGSSCVHVKYYKPPVGSKVTFGVYSLHENLDTALTQVLSSTGVSQANFMNNEARPDRVIIIKTGLGAISSHWRMSNIEEVYFSAAYLASTEFMGRIASVEKLLQVLLSKPVGNYVEDILPLKIFAMANGIDISLQGEAFLTALRNKFPRLRIVGVITNSDRVVREKYSDALEFMMPSTIKDLEYNWLDNIAKKSRLTSIASMVVCRVPCASKMELFSTFRIRPGIYKYDLEVLQEFTEKYSACVLDIARNSTSRLEKKFENNSNSNINNGDSKSDYEKYLDEMSTKMNDKSLEAIIKIAFARTKKEELDEVFNQMSEAGRAKYRRMCGR